MNLTRRATIGALGIAVAAYSLKARADTLGTAISETEPAWRQGISLFEGLKHPDGFKHFEYVNPDAPKGGLVRRGALGTFDNFNVVVAGVKGDLATGIELIYDTLMAPSLDEVSSLYGQLAEAVCYPADHAWAIYRLRPHARWHDGRTVTPDDVIFSLEVFRQWHPQLAAFYRHVARVEQIAEHEVKFSFDAPNNRELPLVMGQLVILPRHWWSAVDGSGRKRDIGSTTLEPPLGSGSYRIASFEPGRTILYERVRDYWGKDLPVKVGTDNFDQFRFEYFRDADVELQAFKAGDLDWRTENAAKNWATGYDFPTVVQKRVVLEEFPIRNIGVMQAFAFNTRRPKFRDRRVRRAFNFAFNFEKVDQELFFGQYKRIDSYFDGTDLAARGSPSGSELVLLQQLSTQVPAEVFETPYWNPVNRNTAAVRANLLEAMRLLDEAGFEVRDLKLVDTETGEPMRVEFLIGDQNLNRIILFYKPALERLGIEVSVRAVDDVQYINRLRTWDFDIVVATWPESLTPGNEQRDYWGSRAADLPGSRNLIGIKNPAIDALIDKLVLAETREELVAAARALDRVLLWNHYVVPHWTLSKVRTARWNRFGRPRRMPEYGLSAFPTLWWWDTGRAAKTGAQS